MQDKNDIMMQPIKFSMWALPESVMVRLLLLILVFAMFITAIWFNAFFTVLGFGILLCVVLWVTNCFEYQEKQLQHLKHRMYVLERQFLEQKHVEQQVSKQQALEAQTLEAQHWTDENNNIISAQILDPAPLSESDTAIVTPPIPMDVLIANRQDIKTEHNANVADKIQTADQSADYQVMTSLWRAGLDWFKGGNSIVRIAVVILLIGVILLLRFASEYWQLTLSAKMAGIATAGFAITALGYFLRQKRFDYAISLQGLGLGILFLVLFSSYHLHALSSVVVAYGALFMLLATTLWLALKQNALVLAFIALSSGFIAPFLLHTGQQNIPSLMAYLAVLNASLAVIALFKPWRILNTVALLLTFGIGGLAIWKYATLEQHFIIACEIWAIFALYLFMSIRYSQHIAPVHQQLKNIPIVDSSLIFATPFMAFSLYAGLVQSDGTVLSMASAVLATVYLFVGYFIHQKFKQLSILSQCFYGLGFVFLALILPFAFNAYWSSVGWAIHGIAMLYLGWRYHLVGAKYFAALLLVISGIASIVANVMDQQSLLFASGVLMTVYALAYYFFRTPSTEQASQVKEQGEQQLDYLLSNFYLVFSFIAMSYFYSEGLERLVIPQQNLSLALLLWFGILSALWWWRDKKWSAHWQIISYLLLSLTAVWTLIYEVLVQFNLNLMMQSSAIKVEFLLIASAWNLIFVGCYYYKSQDKHNTAYFIYPVFASVGLIFLGLMGALWATEQSKFYLTAVLPVAVLMPILLNRYQSWQTLWRGNLSAIMLGFAWLTWVSIASIGDWALPYILIINPVDVLSIIVFVVVAYMLRPYLYSQNRQSQLLSAGSLLIAGLLLVSSILLRLLHHYVALPYWSISAWQNSTIQMSLTILWSVLALVLTLLASRKAWRYIWILGIAVLAVVIAKLIFLDLSHSHTLTRIISFIASGIMMLVIGYFAPLPPKLEEKSLKTETTET